MVGRRQRRERYLQIGEALMAGGLITLVVTPLVYRLHAASKHVVATRSLLWPTAWMVLPLTALLIGVGMIVATSNQFGPRRRLVHPSRREIKKNAVIDLVAEEARDAATRTGSRSAV